MGSTRAKPSLLVGCKADALGTGLSGLSLASRRTADTGRAPTLAKKHLQSKGGEQTCQICSVIWGCAVPL